MLRKKEKLEAFWVKDKKNRIIVCDDTVHFQHVSGTDTERVMGVLLLFMVDEYIEEDVTYT